MSESVWDAQASDPTAARFACWAEDGWDAGVSECLAHVAPVLDAVGHAGGRILDVGCGVGRLLRPLGERWPAAHLIGIDVSAEMLRYVDAPPTVSLLHGSWQHLEPLSPADGAYSVLTFQHMEDADQIGYLAALGRVLTDGAPFVLQFVPEGDEGPLNHPVGVDSMAERCAAAGLRVESVEDHPGRPTWRWIAARA